jgi:hypothetical protein
MATVIRASPASAALVIATNFEVQTWAAAAMAPVAPMSSVGAM